MSNKYDAFTALRNAALNAAGFLEATAKRVGQVENAEIISRLNDVAAILRDADKAADEKFFKPDSEDASHAPAST